MTPTCPCEVCKRSRPIMLDMQAGPDGLPYKLCVKCWLEGVVTRGTPAAQAVATTRGAPPMEQQETPKPARKSRRKAN